MSGMQKDSTSYNKLINGYCLLMNCVEKDSEVALRQSGKSTMVLLAGSSMGEARAISTLRTLSGCGKICQCTLGQDLCFPCTIIGS